MLNPRFIRQLLRDKSTSYRLSFCFRVHFESRDLTFTRVKWYDIISLLALFWSLHNRRLTPGLTISQARQTRHSANRETNASHDFWSTYSKTLRICFYPGSTIGDYKHETWLSTSFPVFWSSRGLKKVRPLEQGWIKVCVGSQSIYHLGFHGNARV